MRAAEKIFRKARVQRDGKKQTNRIQKEYQAVFASVVDFSLPAGINVPTAINQHLIVPVSFPPASSSQAACSPSSSPSISSSLTSKPPVFSLINAPGFFFLPSILSPRQQLQWASRCLRSYSKAYHTNLTNLHGQHNEATVTWEQVCANRKNKNKGLEDKEQEKIEEEESGEVGEGGRGSGGKCPKFDDLRWSSLGYHYDWTARQYDEQHKTPFPLDLADFTSHLGMSIERLSCASSFFLSFLSFSFLLCNGCSYYCATCTGLVALMVCVVVCLTGLYSYHCNAFFLSFVFLFFFRCSFL